MKAKPHRTALLWRCRVSRKRKAAVLAIVRNVFPDATDNGTALEMTVEAGYKDIWAIIYLTQDVPALRFPNRDRAAGSIPKQEGAR